MHLYIHMTIKKGFMLPMRSVFFFFCAENNRARKNRTDRRNHARAQCLPPLICALQPQVDPSAARRHAQRIHLGKELFIPPLYII